MELKKGNIYWLKLSEESVAHPYVVIDIKNELIRVVAITTNQKKLVMPGNVLLEKNEGNLVKHSIVEVAKNFEINKSQLGKYIGDISEKRVKEIQNGIGFLQRTYFPE